MTRPMAAAMPPSVMMLKLIRSTSSRTIVAAINAGTTRTAISVILQLRRNTSSMKAASTTPIMIASRTLVAEAITSSL